jgi:hypothetical protein
MSLDLAVVLAHLTGRVLTPYRFRMPRRVAVDAPADTTVEPMLVPDLFEIPVPYSGEFLFKTWISIPGAVDWTWPSVVDGVFCFPAVPPDADRNFPAFRHGRQHVYALSAMHEDADDLLVRADALANYAHFFYLDAARRREVIGLMRRMRPALPYRTAADAIVARLGSFNAVHIRRGDFLRNALTEYKISRTASVSGDEIVENLASRMDRDDPLLICTDGSPQEPVFTAIRRHFCQAVFLDDVLGGAEGREVVASLPRVDESVTALLTQLIAGRANVFAGTMFSTFTGLIHRQRGLDGRADNFLFTHNDFDSPDVRFDRGEFLETDDGPYTWNRIRYPLSADAYSWVREWPESFI